MPTRSRQHWLRPAKPRLDRASFLLIKSARECILCAQNAFRSNGRQNQKGSASAWRTPRQRPTEGQRTRFHLDPPHRGRSDHPPAGWISLVADSDAWAQLTERLTGIFHITSDAAMTPPL